MGKFDQYRDIGMRTQGRLCIGIVGPMRTGKSTFARNFIRQLMPAGLDDAKENDFAKEMKSDAAGGMSADGEPELFPEKPVTVPVGDGEALEVQVVACIGFPVSQAEGTEEDGSPRMLRTPWRGEPLPYPEAARLWTRNVIAKTASAGLVITTDGTFGELSASDVREAQKNVIRELQALGKPFLVVVNSAKPDGEQAAGAVSFLRESFGAEALSMNCESPLPGDFQKLIERLLQEFPLTRVIFRVPRWVETLDNGHWLKQSLFDSARETMKNLHKVRDVSDQEISFVNPNVQSCKAERPDLGSGSILVSLEMQENLYYQILSEMTGADIRSEYQLISMIRDMAAHRREYEAASEALQEARRTGYGIISPSDKEIQMQEPVLFRQGSRYGVKIRAEAPSIHLIRADIHTEVAPVVGSEEQAGELIHYIRESSGEDDARTLIFGKSVLQLAEEGIQAKLALEGQEERQKLQSALSRIVNESRGRILFILI